MKYVQFISFTFLISMMMVSCGGDKNADTKEKPSAESLKEAISTMEDSLTSMQKMNLRIDNLHRIELINRLLDYYRNYPETEFAPVCLDKTQMIYSTLEATEYAIAYSDTLIEKYPNYKNRELVLESQGANFDIFVSPRDSAKVRKYYTMLLNEFPNMDKEKRQGIIKRLKFNHLTFDEYLSTF